MAKTRPYSGVIRIIAGRLRGRKIPVPRVTGLRPTTDRMRETLFNWLAPYIKGARCLDMFAGSGALAFEAISRGAQDVVLIDRSRYVVDHLRQQIARLDIENARVLQAELPRALPVSTLRAPFDIIFLDPPFAANLLQASCEWLQNNQLLAKPSYLYLEMDKAQAALVLPDTWEVIAQHEGGQVIYRLLRVNG